MIRTISALLCIHFSLGNLYASPKDTFRDRRVYICMYVYVANVNAYTNEYIYTECTQRKESITRIMIWDLTIFYFYFFKYPDKQDQFSSLRYYLLIIIQIKKNRERITIPSIILNDDSIELEDILFENSSFNFIYVAAIFIFLFFSSNFESTIFEKISFEVSDRKQLLFY